MPLHLKGRHWKIKKENECHQAGISDLDCPNFPAGWCETRMRNSTSAPGPLPQDVPQIFAPPPRNSGQMIDRLKPFLEMKCFQSNFIAQLCCPGHFASCGHSRRLAS
ncbi:hypothetical protein PoB_001242300 [Plakobranchus ocellatus]|uniref:Uncharacterized protein n=1 Tax=Plakobranchus ocellatus TaxID=259542 RepID=A0AAV3YU95_9GAST|nr:hypothetical protein PoB_001242300 [Plakobranchus ocellatus]